MKCGCITRSFNIDWLFQKRGVRTKLDIYVYISITVSIPLLVDYQSPGVSSAQ